MKKKFALPIACISMLVFAACGDNDESGNIPNGSDDRTIVQQGIVPTVLTVTVEGTVNGVEQAEINYGMIGLLYCTERDNATDLFQEWKSTGNLPENSVKMGGWTKKSNNGIISTTIEGLEPNTSYSACLFFRPSTGKKRIVSKTFTFKTGNFDVQAITEDISDVRYYSVVLNGRIKGLDPADRKACTMGFVVSEEEDPTVGSGRTIEIENASETVLSTTLRGLLPSRQYNCRIFIQPVGHDDYTYGNNIAFRSKSPDDMAIDLGLSVEWSRLLLGAEEEGQRGNFYLWGDVNPAAANSPVIDTQNGNRNRVYYENVTAPNRPDFSISGTGYDAATYALGEGWRTPTRADFEELVTSCQFDVEMDPNADVLENVTVVYGDGREVKLPVVHLSCDNLHTINKSGKVIKVPTSDYAYIRTKQDGSGISMSKTSGNDQTYAYFWASDIFINTNKNTGTQTTVGPCYYYTNGSWIYAPELYSLSNDEEWTLTPSGSSALYAYPILPVRDRK
jgi:hypothetical protein